MAREQDVIFTLEGKNRQVVCKIFTANDVFFKILKIVFFKKCVGSPVDKILQHLSIICSGVSITVAPALRQSFN